MSSTHSTAYNVVAALHAGVGALALLSFWAAALSSKGGRLHRAAGKTFFLTMILIGLTTVPLLVGVYRQGYHAWTAFLAFLDLFVGSHCWMAWQAVRFRRAWSGYLRHGYRPLAVANLVAGLGILLLGATTGRVLLVAFSFAGIFAGCFNLAVARRPPTDAGWWLREHLRANLNNGTATHISFLTIGLERLFPSAAGLTLMRVGWLVPLAISIVLRIWLEWRLRPSAAAG